MDLTADLLLRAYAGGIFPMAESGDTQDVFWVDPPERGILPLDGVHVPKRLARTIKQRPYEVRVNAAFRKVMRLCAQTADNRESTWINDTLLDLYGQLHDRGHAHSVECWHRGELVGGLYGVSLYGAFFGESMFHRAPNASKIALIYLVARLRSGSYQLLDTQFTTDHLNQFGTVEISRKDYQKRLSQALKIDGNFYRLPAASTPSEILQSVTQTS